MITKEELKKFVNDQTISGEEACYVSSVTKPKKSQKNLIVMTILLILASVLISTVVADFVEVNRFVLMIGLSAIMLVPIFFLTSMLYKKTSRQLIAVTNIRFLIYEYKRDLIKMQPEDLSNYLFKKEISFDAIENLKLPSDQKNTGVLIMVFEEENESKNGYVKAKLHLEIEDCEAVRKAVPARLRPDASKDDYWERTYRD